MTLANYITLSRVFLIPLEVALLLFGIYGLAAFLFLFLAAGDAVDGYIARRFNQASDFGKILDPLADKILVIATLIALVELGRAGSIPVMIIAIRELLVHGLRAEAAQNQEFIAAIPIAKWKTAVQMIAVLMCMLNLPLAGFALWAAVAFSLISGGAYLWKNQTLHQLKSSLKISLPKSLLQ